MGLVTTPAQFEVWLVNLDPTVGAEIRKTRHALVVSPDEMNRHLRTAMVAPMTTGARLAKPGGGELSGQGRRDRPRPAPRRRPGTPRAADRHHWHGRGGCRGRGADGDVRQGLSAPLATPLWAYIP